MVRYALRKGLLMIADACRRRLWGSEILSNLGYEYIYMTEIAGTVPVGTQLIEGYFTRIMISSSSGPSIAVGGRGTGSRISLFKYSRMYLSWGYETMDSVVRPATVHFGVYRENYYNASIIRRSRKQITTRVAYGTLVVDINDISAMYYINAMLNMEHFDKETCSGIFYIYRIWLEK